MFDMITDIKFNDSGLIPAITQDYRTDEVLMLAWMNAESLQKTLETGKVHYYSRSRQSLWLKGETSGHFQFVKSVSFDCDCDTILLKVEQVGAACHTGHRSCFFRKFEADGLKAEEHGNDNATVELKAGALADDTSIETAGPVVLKQVFDVISDRVLHPKEGSYTNYLFDKGLDKILKKIGEESSEVIIASKNGKKDEIKAEVSDLLYHVMVLLVERGMSLEDIYEELKGRR
jgi:phosphoribosyl-AMP cyclohydrolase / phosphoribosyl-ATP pyrophosphohydrolase